MVILGSSISIGGKFTEYAIEHKYVTEAQALIDQDHQQIESLEIVSLNSKVCTQKFWIGLKHF